MKHTIKITLLFLISFTICAAVATAQSGAVVGEKAPNFELTDAYGETHNLSDFEGKYVILEWLNHDCPFVKKHYDGNNMQELQKRYTDEGAIWLSIISSVPGTQGHLQPEEAQEITKAKNASPTAVLLDVDGAVGKMYDARVTPHMYIINPEGVLEYNGAIDDKPTARLRDLEGAHNYVVAAMTSLMNGEPVEVKTNTPYGCTVKYE